MKILTIVRHAKSSWDDPSLRDHERPLNKRGHRNAPEMGRRIAEHGLRPSLIVSSTAVRAWSTAKAVAKAVGYPYEFLEKEPNLYHASVDRILDVIRAQDERCNNLMLVKRKVHPTTLPPPPPPPPPLYHHHQHHQLPPPPPPPVHHHQSTTSPPGFHHQSPPVYQLSIT